MHVSTCGPAFVWIVGESCVCGSVKLEMPALVLADDVEFLMSFEVLYRKNVLCLGGLLSVLILALVRGSTEYDISHHGVLEG